MKAIEIIECQWPYFSRLIGSPKFIEESATRMGAIQRRRGIKNADTLLRLAFIYGFCGCSLRQTAAYMEASGLAAISDVAVLKRLRQAGDWIGFLLASKLAERASASLPTKELRLRIVDASTVNRPGTHGTDFRLHLGLNLDRLWIDHVEITDSSGGETLKRFEFTAGDLVIADRGYGHAAQLVEVASANAIFLVRINWQNIPLETPDGERFDIVQALRTLPEAEAGDFPVAVRRGDTLVACRMVALRKSESAAEAARQKCLRENGKKGRSLDPRTLETAGFTFVLTNAPSHILPTAEALELYRFRWQVELVFKRLKSLLDLDVLPAKDPDLARTYLLTKLLAALVIDDMTERYRSFSPWGYRLEGPLPLYLAPSPNPL